ncbi:calcium and integrin-binding family member 3-like [Liolophura sinensis]|uniref:calcium and integrin-binding family member 3-like n=1 Tax=Liolophura sinensis TaxID=3198878 RepID=UPI0031580DB6
MGNQTSSFSDEQFEAYQDCTFFTRKEIVRVFKRYRELAPNIVPFDMKGDESSQICIPYDIIEKMPELKENPFRQRICEVFSEDGSGKMSFDDFLDMFSVFSKAAPRDIKTVYAFRIYDFDGDNYLGRGDLEKTLRSLTRNELSSDDVEFVVDKVFEEADLDDDNMLSYIEFEHVISRAPDFLETFHIRI